MKSVWRQLAKRAGARRYGLRRALSGASREIALRLALGATYRGALWPLCRWQWISAALGMLAAVGTLVALHRYAQALGYAPASFAPLSMTALLAAALATAIMVLGALPALARMRLLPVARILTQ